MISDHIKYLKLLIEESITGRDGSGTPLNRKLFEIYPLPSTIGNSVPCSAIRYRPGKSKRTGVFERVDVEQTEITKIKQLYEMTHLYQVDMFSKDIYDFIEKDETYVGYYNQLINLIADNPFFLGENGKSIGVTCIACGILDDEKLIVDGIYKTFCQVQFLDGVYRDIVVPRITGVKFNEGGILDG